MYIFPQMCSKMEESGKEELVHKSGMKNSNIQEASVNIMQEKTMKNDFPVPRCRGLRPVVGILERDLWCWYSAQVLKVPKRVIQMRARWIFQQAGITSFKASDGWFRRWFKRWQKYGKKYDNNGPYKAITSEFCLSCDKGNCKISEHDENKKSLNQHVPTSDKYFDSAGNIVTPSLGDTLDCTVQSLEPGQLPSHQIEKISSLKDWKEDANILTPVHDSFEKYLRISKIPRLKDGEHMSRDSSSASGRREEKSVSQGHGFNAPLRISSKKKKGNSRNKQIQNFSMLRRERIQHVGKRYHPQFKERVLSYLKSHTFKETACKFRVHQASISAWQKDKLRYKLTEEGVSTTSNVNSTPTPAPADSQFLSWLRRERGRALTTEEVHACAHRLVSLAGGLAVVERQVRWFAQWVNRLNEKLYEEGIENKLNNVRLSEHRIQYPAAFRTEVAEFAAKYSQMAAVRTFNVSRKCVFEWLRSHQITSFPETSEEDMHLHSSDPEIQRPGSGRSVTDLEVDQLVWQWYSDSQNQEQGGGRRPSSKECSYGWFRRWCERFNVRLRYSTDDELLAWALAQLDCNHALSHADLQEQARCLWQKQRPDFKASPGWAIRFCKRYPKLLQTIPTITTPLPEPLKPLVVEFRVALQELIQKNALPLDAVGSMDELHLGFSAPPAGVPKRQLLLRRPGMDSCHATVVLSCLANGTLLPTMLILKDEVELSKSDPNLIVIQQDNGIMDLRCMEKWLDLVWFRYAPCCNLLVTDSFGPHCASEVAEKFAKEPDKKRLHRLIPAGCSSKLQPLEVAIKRSFQRYLDQCWERLNTQNGVAWTCGQQLRLPTAIELMQWVTDAHCYVMSSRQETIRRSFLVTGLLVADNHSEDHFIENPAALPPEDHLLKFDNKLLTE